MSSNQNSKDGGLIMINIGLGQKSWWNLKDFLQAWLAVRQQQDDFRAELRAIADQERCTGVVGSTTCESEMLRIVPRCHKSSGSEELDGPLKCYPSIRVDLSPIWSTYFGASANRVGT